MLKLPKIEFQIEKDEDGHRIYKDIHDFFVNDLNVELATLVVNKYSSFAAAMRNVLPKFDNFDIIKEHTVYLWSVHTLDENDFEDFNMASFFRNFLLRCCRRLIDIRKFLLKMSNAPCYICREESMLYASVRSKVILCLQGLSLAFDHVKTLHVDAQQMKRLSIFMKLENLFPTVDWFTVENKFLKLNCFSSGGDFGYKEYLNRVVTIFQEVNTIVLAFWEGFPRGDEEPIKWEDKIRSWLKKSEFYFKTKGKPIDGIVGESIAFSYCLAAASALRAYCDSCLFFKEMAEIVERRVDYIAHIEPYHIDESLLKFAAEANRTQIDIDDELEEMFGDINCSTIDSDYEDSD